MVLLAVGGVAVIEQPSSSILTEHRAFKQLMYLLRKRAIPATRLLLRRSLVVDFEFIPSVAVMLASLI